MEQSIDQPFETLRAQLETWLHRPDVWVYAVGVMLGYLFIWWRIIARAGFPGSLSFLMLTPLAPLLWVFLGLVPWPARRELRALRRVQRVVHEAERRRLAA